MNDAKQPVLVTGATGFTGRALALELKRRGHEVRAFIRDREKAQDLEQAGIHIFEGDLLDADSIDRAVAGCSHVYHIAAAFRAAGFPDSHYQDINAEAVRKVLDSAKKHSVQRTVHCSTVGVHGNVKNYPSDESAPYNPGDVYQDTKLAGEKIAQEAMARGEPVSVVRPAGIYGPGDLRFLKLFKTVQNGTFRMFGNGETLYHFTYIDDLVDGIILCGEHPKANGEIFIICGNEYVTLNKLVEHVAHAVGAKVPKLHLPLWPLLTAARLCELICKPFKIDPPLHTRRCEFFIKNRAFTNAKAAKLLGYQSKIPIDKGILQTSDWYKKNKYIK